MFLKKLSFTLLALLSLNAYSMEKQSDEKPGDEKSNKQASGAKSPKAKKLKFLCAQQILEDDIPSETLTEDLKDYLNNFNKLEEFKEYKKELRKHKLAPVFKKYLIGCFDYLSLESLKGILQIIDKANEISEQKCFLIQRMIPLTCKRVFCDNPILIVCLFNTMFPNQFIESFSEILEEKRKFYSDTLTNLENEDKNICNKRSDILLLIEVLISPNMTADSPYLKECADAAESGSAPALNTLGGILALSYGIPYTIDCIKDLIKLKSIDHAAELIGFVLAATYGQPLFSHRLEVLQRRNFCNCLNDYIKMVFDGNNYNSDYDVVLAFIYNYLNHKEMAKKYAKKCLKDNENLAAEGLFRILRDIYKQEGKTKKEKFYINQLKEIEDLRNA